jgi:hypothetical protein
MQPTKNCEDEKELPKEIQEDDLMEQGSWGLSENLFPPVV